MEVSIVLKAILFGADQAPGMKTAVVAFEIESDDVDTIEFNVDVVPDAGGPDDGIDGAVMIARRTLIEFGKALVAAGERYEPPMIYSPKSGRSDRDE